MRLYHYTAVHHLHGGIGHPGPGILKVGLLSTVHPYIDLAAGMVWLTSNADWSQTWSTRDVPVPGFGPCNRTEARIEVVIPRAARAALRPWSEARALVVTPGLRSDLERFGDPAHWWIYAGRIPPGWLRFWEPRSAAA